MSIQTHFHRICTWLALGLGSGLLPKMPGTWGSLLGAIALYFYTPSPLEVGLLVVLSWLVINDYEKHTGPHDDSRVVIDEIAGIAVSFLGIKTNLPILVAGFVVFRILDITKPLGIGWIDRRMPGAWGTLLDDIAAGLLTCIILHLAVNYRLL